MMTTETFGMPHIEEYQTTGGTAQIEEVGAYLNWEVNLGGERVAGSSPIGDDGMAAALHRCRVQIDERLRSHVPARSAAETPAAPETGKATPIDG